MGQTLWEPLQIEWAKMWWWRQIASWRLVLCMITDCRKQHPYKTLLWRHNGRDGVSYQQPYDGLLNRLFRRRSKKASKLRVTGLCAGNSPVTSEFPTQMASNAENVSIWWRRHGRAFRTNLLLAPCCFWWWSRYKKVPVTIDIIFNSLHNRKFTLNIICTS